MSVENKIQVGLIGYGFAGRAFHAPVITSVPGLHLSKVVERHHRYSKERYPWVDVVKDVQELWDDQNISLVVVATPSSNHYQMAKDALLANKHVVIDKPFTTSTEEADELIALAKERNRLLSVYHNRRWDGDFLTIKEIVDSEILGRITEVEMRWDRYQPEVNPNSWREQSDLGSGILFDLGVHFFDQVQCLFGLPKELVGHVDMMRDGAKTDDAFQITLLYDRLRINVSSTKLGSQEGPRYRLNGLQGSFVKYGVDPQEAALIRGELPTAPRWGEESEESWGTLYTRVNGLEYRGKVKTKAGAYTGYYEDIYQSILTGKAPAVTADQARNTIRLVELAKHSSETKKIVSF